jgi:hypothetical protein
MPNQLAQSKRRQSLAEHAAVLAALTEIARRERTTGMALLRESARNLVRERLADRPILADEIRPAILRAAPQMPKRFQSAAQAARFKRSQREFDRVLLELGLASPLTVQERNSLFPSHHAVRVLEFESDHAAVTV